MQVNIIGGGLAGSESAYQLAKRGIKVKLFEFRDDNQKTFAHQTKNLAELVCSNSLRCDDVTTAIGLLHEEMRQLDSLIIRAADNNKLPAGSALAVDREAFSKFIENELIKTGNVEIIRREVAELPIDDKTPTIVATGPLTSDKLSQSIIKQTGEENLSFFDAIAPIIYKDSIDFSKAWFQSRYDKIGAGGIGEYGAGKDYINLPLDKKQYEEFVKDLNEGEKTEFKEWEKDTPYFEGCLPIEVMASRGLEVLRFGPLKPVGLTNPHFEPLPPLPDVIDEKGKRRRAPWREDPSKPYAVIQLRQDNKIGTLYNMVGFQTKLKYGEQKRIFSKISGLENAEFARFGGIHRNSFINSPKLLKENLSFKKFPHIKFAGQITGVEGYVESAAMGLLAGIFTAFELSGKTFTTPDATTAIGSLLNHITKGYNEARGQEVEKTSFQPMNVNFGLFLPLEEKTRKTDRKTAYSQRALQNLQQWLKTLK